MVPFIYRYESEEAIRHWNEFEKGTFMKGKDSKELWLSIDKKKIKPSAMSFLLTIICASKITLNMIHYDIIYTLSCTEKFSILKTALQTSKMHNGWLLSLMQEWSLGRDLIPRPTAYEAAALPGWATEAVTVNWAEYTFLRHSGAHSSNSAVSLLFSVLF